MKTIKVCILVVAPLAILLSVMFLAAFDLEWFQKQFVKTDVYQQLGQERVDEQTRNLLAYLNGPEQLNQGFYTEREILHLQDVHGLLIGFQVAAAALLIIIFILIAWYASVHTKPQLLDLFSLIGLVGLASYVCFGLLVVLGFDAVFWQFHQIAFTNDLWLLNPETEKLIVIFPPELFAKLAARIVVLSVAFSLGLVGVSQLIKSKLKIS